MKKLTLLGSSALLVATVTAAHAGKSTWLKSMMVGYGVTSADQTQTFRLNNTPAPGLDNRYLGRSTLRGAAMLGLGLEKRTITADTTLSRSIGIELDYLQNNAVNGTVEPMVNVSSDFDELRYAYDIHSAVLQLTGKFVKERVAGCLNGYLQAGVGLAANILGDYREYAPDLSTGSPMLRPFANKTTVDVAISAGAGFTRQTSFGEVTVGYRYFNTGRGRLKKSPLQQTNNAIVLRSLNFHFLHLSVMF